ncbi:MAG: hypothetical protein O7G85_02715 [Planctomycetota bacterium]|nr:hypothetical protein [Planctomycetota bacterium]
MQFLFQCMFIVIGLMAIGLVFFAILDIVTGHDRFADRHWTIPLNEIEDSYFRELLESEYHRTTWTIQPLHGDGGRIHCVCWIQRMDRKFILIALYPKYISSVQMVAAEKLLKEHDLSLKQGRHGLRRYRYARVESMKHDQLANLVKQLARSMWKLPPDKSMLCSYRAGKSLIAASTAMVFRWGDRGETVGYEVREKDE